MMTCSCSCARDATTVLRPQVQAEREQNVYKMASEGATLEAQRDAASLSERNAAYERSVVAKEREALLDHQKSVDQQREEAEAQRRSLHEASAQLATARDELKAKVEQTETQRVQVTELARATAYEAEAVAARQRQLQEQSAELLRGGPLGGVGRPPPPVPAWEASGAGPAGPPAAGSRADADAVSRANYTASGLGAFTLPLMATQSGLPADRIASIGEATYASTSSRAAAVAAAAPTATPTGEAPALAAARPSTG